MSLRGFSIIVFLFILLLSGLLLNCGDSNSSAQEPQQQESTDSQEPVEEKILPLSFEQQQVEKHSESCLTDSMRCAHVKLQYPLAKNGDPAIAKAINDSINYYIKISAGAFYSSEEIFSKSVDNIIDEFILEYNEVAGENTDFVVPWEIETEGKVLYESDKVISIEISCYSFTGGAHPNSFSYFLNFDPSTGRVYTLKDWIKDTKALSTLADDYFRKAKGFAPKEDYFKAGYFWDGKFELPENFALLEEGIHFFYNTYEIGPYVLGPSEFTIDYTTLESLLSQSPK